MKTSDRGARCGMLLTSKWAARGVTLQGCHACHEARSAHDGSAARRPQNTQPAARQSQSRKLSSANSPVAGRAYVAFLDATRVVAIAGVVAIHVASPLLVTLNPGHPGTWWVGNLVFAITRWTVPAFVMIAGALALTSTPRSVSEYYRRRLPRIAIPLVFWSIAYWLFRRMFWGQDLDVVWALRSVLTSTTYGHLYFLAIMLGLSVITPLLVVFWQSASKQDRVVVTSMAMLLGLAFRLLQEIRIVGNVTLIDWWLPYVGFYLAGALLLDLRPTTAVRPVAVVVFLTTAAGIAMNAWIARTSGSPLSVGLTYSYLGPLTVLNSLSAYAVATTLTMKVSPRRLRVVASLVLGIYLVNPMLVALLQRLIGSPGTAAMAVAAVVLETIAVLGIAALVTAVGSRVPYLRTVFV